jgi:threonine/homoserine/homoserine lactone efflux protein
VLAFALFAAVLTVTPGLDTMLVVRTAAASGRWPALAAALGVGTGCLAWALAGALGITALLTASELAYQALRWAGAAYLGYLGLGLLWRSRRPSADTSGQQVDRAVHSGAVPGGAGRAYRVGLGTNLLNPKIGVFYLSVLPQFIPAGAAPLPYSLALALIHDAEGMLWFAALVLLVGRVAGWLARPAVRRRLDQLTGVVFVAFGVRLAVQRTP